MLNTILSQITPDILGAVGVAGTTIVVAIIKSLGDVGVQYINKRKDFIEKELDSSKHQQELQTAKEVWNIVDEKFRISDDLKATLKSKADEFDKILLAKIPYLTADEVADIRQAIAGEINKGKEALNKDSLKEQQIAIVQQNANLTNENAQLKSKIEQLQNLVK